MRKILGTLDKVFACILCLVTFLAVLPAYAAAQGQDKVVRVGWYEDAYNITGKHGEQSGYAYEFEQAVAAYTGWKYEYVKAGWSDLLAMVQRGEIDLMAGVSYTDARAQTMLFSELPMGQEKYYLYADLRDAGISASDLTTLNGKNICLLENSIQATQFMEWEAKHGLHLNHIYVNSFEAGKKGVANHEFDCVISTETPAWVEAGLSSIATTGGSGIYFVINKARPDLKEDLDNAMRKMEYDKPFYADELYKRYLSAASNPVLASEEKEWLTKHGAIRIGYLRHDSGFSNVDEEDGKLIGIINDYIKFAEDCLGNDALKFQLVEFTSQVEEVQALKDGKIDMIFHFTETPYFAEQNGFILSNTVVSMTMPAVTYKDVFKEDEPNKIALAKDNLMLKWYISYNYPQWDVVECASFSDAEAAVQQGKADCFIANYRQLTKYIEDKKLRSIFLTQTNNTCFAVNRGNTLLLSILNKTLKTMPASMLTGALSTYDNTMRKVTMMDFVKDNLVLVAAGSISTFVVILLIILGLLRKSKKAEASAKKSADEALGLNKQLQESQKALEAALEQAKEANAAKSNFLFNMSHDIRTPMNALLGYTKIMKTELKDKKLLGYQEKMEQAGNLLLSILNNVLDMARIESGKAELDENYNRVGSILGEICAVFEVEAQKKHIHIEYTEQVEHGHIMCDGTKIKEIFTNLLSNAIKYTPNGGTIRISSKELPASKPGYVRIVTQVADTGIGMSKEYLPLLFEPFTRERNTTAGKVGGTGLGMPIVKKLVEMMGGTIEVASELGKGTTFTITLEHRLADKAYYEQQKQVNTAHAAANKEMLHGKHILLAEDNELNAEIAAFLLQNMGLVVDRVADGIQCVSTMEAKPAGTYDLILMDIQMPHMDGYKATRAIRNFADKQKANIPIVAMTANAFEEDRKNALKAGMNEHIAKPIDVAKMEQILLELLQ